MTHTHSSLSSNLLRLPLVSTVHTCPDFCMPMKSCTVLLPFDASSITAMNNSYSKDPSEMSFFVYNNEQCSYLPTYLPGNHVLSYFQSPITLLQVCWQYKSEVLSTNSTLYNTTVQQFMQTSPLPLWRQKWKGAWPSCVITCMRNFQKSGQHWCMCEQALLSADQPPLSIRAWGVLYWHILRYRPDC